MKPLHLFRTTPFAFIVAAGLLSSATFASGSQVVSLAGRWRFQLDREDAGIRNRWFSEPLAGRIRLPGALAAQGIGDDITTNTPWSGGIVDRSWYTAPEYAKYRQAGNVKVPFWLQPEKYYKGAAWYQRDITIPAAWAGQSCILALERPHWETRVWVDDRLIGTNNALATPHQYDLGLLSPGKHTLTVRVDNRMIVDVGHDSHSVSDHTQGNWNGIAGRIELRPRSLVWIEDLQLYPNAEHKTVRVVVTATNASGKNFAGKLDLVVLHDGKPLRLPVSLNFNTQAANLSTSNELDLGPNAPLWDEFHPSVLTLRATMRGELDEKPVEYSRELAFGLRDISTVGTQISVNGRRTFLRGTLECAIFPKTGHPPTDEESWRKVILAAKAHGLNLLRFHSWCPPEAAFRAADELGMYFHIECSSWANSSTTLGDGKPIDTWIYEEADRILKAYGNHPSFILMLYGNEPGGKNYPQFLAKWVDHYKALDSRRLYSSGAGWPQLPENQFHVTPDPRVQAWGGGLHSRINGHSPETTTDYRSYITNRSMPVISHEIGQWCVYPNFDEISKYTGYLKPKNFEIFRDTLREHHMEGQARKFLYASGKLQTLCYKEDIESALRTTGMGGFELLDLHDFPGQGTALVGVLDPFWESKGYVTPQEYRRFCNSTVPLSRLQKRVFTADETLSAEIEVAHFGPEPLRHVTPSWRLVADSRKTVLSGSFAETDVPIGNGIRLGSLQVPLKTLAAPARYKLVAAIAGYENDWDIWVYPTASALPTVAGSSNVVVADSLDAAAMKTLNSGGRVLLLIPPARVAPDKKLGKTALGFSSIFWNTAWTHRQPPHTLGVLCHPSHPLLASFPTDSYSNWQWWYLISRAGAMILDDLPPRLRPTVQVIDDWVTARRLGLVFEAKVSAGKLLACSIDLQNGLETNSVARQFRQSLLTYIASERFRPEIFIKPEQVRALYVEPSALARLGARVVKTDSEEPGFEADHLIDGDDRSMWHSQYSAAKTAFPHEFVVALARPAEITGFQILPRQDNNRNGWIKDFAIYMSADGQTWGEPVAKDAFARTSELKRVRLPAPVRARYIKFVARSGFDNQPYASMAEFEIETQ